MLFLSGMQKIDDSLYEAARLDGAGAVREFFAVTLPALRGEIAVALTITVVAALASFDIVFVTTNGSPGDTTTVPGLLVYRLAFTNGQVGLASALAVTLTVLIVGGGRRDPAPDAGVGVRATAPPRRPPPTRSSP